MQTTQRSIFPQHKNLVSLISDRSIDFTPVDFDAPLNDAQVDYIQHRTSLVIPKVFWRRQVHEDTILIVSDNMSSWKNQPDADACITNKKNVPLAIRTADCVPVFIYDAAKHVIGLAHAGWKGTHLGIAQKTIRMMQDIYHCQWHDLWVYLGPAIRTCCYQVSHEFKAYFPLDIIDHEDGSIHVDIIAANRRQIQLLGLNPVQIVDSGICTCCEENYFSYRRDKEKAGRMISLMMLV